MEMRKILGPALAKIYKVGLLTSQACYKKGICKVYQVNARVISVGNITWGGTGKTPLVAMLAAEIPFYFNKRVAILIRGYGADEVLMLQKRLPNCPILVGRDRIRTAREAVEKHKTEIIILDDGFQHIRLRRDLDIVTINATLPFGPGGLIPMGSLREPIDHLSRADIFILTKSDIGSKNIHWIRQKIASIKPNAPIFEAFHRPTGFIDGWNHRQLPLDVIRSRKVAAISGIGDPHSFEKSIEKLGAEVVFAARYDDHHQYRMREIHEFVRRCRSAGINEAVTTEKDFMRLKPLLSRKHRPKELERFNFLAMQIEFAVHDEENLIRRCVGM